MKESQLENAIIESAHRLRWIVAHFSPSPITRKGETIYRTAFKADSKGFPDLVLVRERLVLAELKIHPRKPSDEQLEWARRLTAAGVEVYLWTNRDWASGVIEEVLR